MTFFPQKLLLLAMKVYGSLHIYIRVAKNPLALLLAAVVTTACEAQKS